MGSAPGKAQAACRKPRRRGERVFPPLQAACGKKIGASRLYIAGKTWDAFAVEGPGWSGCPKETLGRLPCASFRTGCFVPGWEIGRAFRAGSRATGRTSLHDHP